MDLIEKLNKLEKELEGLTVQELAFTDKEVQDLIIELNRTEQLFKRGINADGEVIGYYSQATMFLSNGRKKAGSPYNFYDTGNFFDSFGVKQTSNGDLEIMADTIKIDNDGNSIDLIKKYGEEILGLFEESKKILAKKIVPIIQEGVREQFKRLLS